MSSTRPIQAVAAAASVLLVLLLTSGALAPSAQAAACDGSTGVTVVADFTALGGGVQVRCAPGDPASGLAALSGAGFSYTFPSRQPGFICRIDGQPTAEKDKCVSTPPADASWAYWHAKRGGSWEYSQEGAGTYDPKPGSVEGWAFGAGDEPRTAPPAAAASPTAQPRPTITATPRGASSPAASQAAASRPAVVGSTPTPGATPTGTVAPTATATALPGPTTSASPDPVASTGVTDVPRSTAGAPEQGGNRLPLLLGGAAVALLVGSTILTARRRGQDGA